MMLGRVQLKSISGKSNAIERGSMAIWTGTLSSGGRLWWDDLSVGLRGTRRASASDWLFLSSTTIANSLKSIYRVIVLHRRKAWWASYVFVPIANKKDWSSPLCTTVSLEVHLGYSIHDMKDVERLCQMEAHEGVESMPPLMTPPLSLRCSSVKRQKGSGGGMFKCQSKVSHLESTQPPLLGCIIC